MNTVLASSKLTRCFFKLLRALFSSHSNNSFTLLFYTRRGNKLNFYFLATPGCHLGLFTFNPFGVVRVKSLNCARVQYN
ncbi:hypothetical protein BGS_1265 [Beggiatoa sp. SS]|nr:hypothetical protein BGS_1265 [Beggiatoa sp. SS]